MKLSLFAAIAMFLAIIPFLMKGGMSLGFAGAFGRGLKAVKKSRDMFAQQFYREHNFKKDASGNLILTENDLSDFGTDVAEAAATAAVEQLKKDLKLDVAPPPPGSQGDPNHPGAKKNFDKPEGFENDSRKRKRLGNAMMEVRGGKLTVEDAPKEIKVARYFQAVIKGDDATVKALGEQSWVNAKALSEGSATDGGNLVPIEFATDLLVAIEEYTAVADCSQHQMMSNELDLRSVTTKPTIYQVGEQIAPTEAGTKFGKPTITAKAFAGTQVMSRELFQDNNVGLYDKLLTLFAEAFAARKSKELFIGQSFTGLLGGAGGATGGGGTLGAAGVNETTVTGASFRNVKYQNIVDLVNSLSPGQLKNGGKFYMHRVVWAYIQSMVDLNERPIVINPWDAKNRALLGYPVVLDEQLPSADAAATRFIAFGNLFWADHGVRQEIYTQVMTEGTVASVNLGEQRSYGLVIDTRWVTNISLPGNLAALRTT